VGAPLGPSDDKIKNPERDNKATCFLMSFWLPRFQPKASFDSVNDLEAYATLGSPGPLRRRNSSHLLCIARTINERAMQHSRKNFREELRSTQFRPRVFL
jgi:hypothetical protein